MSDQFIFCENCGFKNTNQNNFCEKCGTTLPKIGHQPQAQPQPQQPQTRSPQSNQFSNLSNFGAPQGGFQPVQMSQIEPWNEGGVISASTLIFTDTNRVAPSLLIDPNAPSSTILVFLWAIVYSIFLYFTATKVTYTFTDKAKAAGYSTTLGPALVQQSAVIASIFGAIGILLVWVIGSAILGMLLKGGFPYGHPITQNMGRSMRQLNGYRYVPQIILTVILIIVLYLQPNKVVLVDVGAPITVLGTTVPQPIETVVTNYSSLYLTLSLVLVILGSLISLYLLYRATKALDYKGVWVGLIIFIEVIVLLFQTRII